MIKYDKTTLDNGLCVITHTDRSTPMAAVNLIYRVGSRNESPEHTGFAHLFEHLMFGGSRNIPDFDAPLQRACGENNAFTNNDYTDYYITLPAENLDTAFWLESDRMLELAFSDESLEVQRKVVIEEFNQRYLNQPYGDVWLLLRPLAYRVHPYRWCTIGITPEHIANATMQQVKEFFYRYYAPDNAILSVVSPEPHARILERVAYWFGDLPRRGAAREPLPVEPQQTEERRLEVERDVPVSLVVMAFHMGRRDSHAFHVADVISDVLSNGDSSRLYQTLVKEQRLCSGVNAYVTGELDEGLFVVTGYAMEGVAIERVEEALRYELQRMATEPVSEYELEKVHNKFESGALFGDMNVMNKAMNLGFYELIGHLEWINTEPAIHRSVTADEVQCESRRLFRRENCSTLLYKARKS